MVSSSENKILSPRIVSREVLDALDPIERLIAEKFIREGRWKLGEAAGDGRT